MAYIGNAPGQSTQRITTTFTATQGQTSFNPVSGYTPGYADVYLNGVKLIDTNDYTATDGVTVVLNQGAALDDVVEVLAYVPRGLTDGYTKIEADARYATEAQGTLADSAVQPNDDVALGALSADGFTITASTPSIQMTDSDNNADAYIQATDGNLRFYADDSNEAANSIITFNIDGSEEMRINSDGVVGINDIDPGSSAAFGGGIKLQTADNTNTGYSATGSGRTPYGTQLATYNTAASSSSLSGIALSNRGPGGAAMGSYIGSIGSSSVSWSANIVFGTTSGSNSYVERMRISELGHLLLGTEGAYDSLGTLVVQQTEDSKGIAIIDSAEQNTFFIENQGDEIKFRGNTNNPITFAHSTGEKMRIDQAGNVGIATIPKIWKSNSNVLEIGEFSIEDYAISGSNATNILFNGYRDTDNVFKRKVDGYSAKLGSYQGDFSVRVYGTGNADDVLAADAAFRVTPDGYATGNNLKAPTASVDVTLKSYPNTVDYPNVSTDSFTLTAAQAPIGSWVLLEILILSGSSAGDQYMYVTQNGNGQQDKTIRANVHGWYYNSAIQGWFKIDDASGRNFDIYHASVAASTTSDSRRVKYRGYIMDN